MTRGPLDFLGQRGRTRKTSIRYRDPGALYAHHLNTDLVVINGKRDPAGKPLWSWAEQNRDPSPGKHGMFWDDAVTSREGPLHLVYDPRCQYCPGDLVGCHDCHQEEFPGKDMCRLCGRGLLMTDPHGYPTPITELFPVVFPREKYRERPRYNNPECLDADLNEVPAEELGEHDPMYVAVNDALTEWYCDPYVGDPHYEHRVATFLDTLAARGYRVTKIEAPDLGTMLPAPEGNQ